MTAELVPGQNHPLPSARLEVRVSAARPVAAAVVLTDGSGRAPGPGRVAHCGAAPPPGVAAPGPPAAGHHLALDLGALPPGVERLHLALALPPGAGAFGATAAPHTDVATPDGTGVASFTLAGLTAETAVVALEFYLRAGAWKVRAVGQGYAGGMAALLHDHGVPDAAALAAAVTAGPDRPVHPGSGLPGPGRPRPTPSATAPNATAPTPPPATAGPPVPVAGDAPGLTMDERLYNQVWGVFEDAARSAAAYRSAADFADSRQEAELEALLADPAARFGPAAESARREIRARRDDLERRAREVLERDSAQLLAEMRAVEAAMPAPMARWDAPVWADWRAPREEPPYAVRLGDLHLPDHPGLRVPMLVRMPLPRGLWVDAGASPDHGVPGPGVPGPPPGRGGLRGTAAAVAAALAARLLACRPPGGMLLHAVDPDGAAAAALAPFARAGLLAGPPATGLPAVAALVDSLVKRVDLVRMALRGGADDALPPSVDRAARLLLVHDFPYGFDDRTVGGLRYLAEEGPAAGVHLLLVADRADAAGYGPALDPFWHGLTRLSPVPQDCLADPWVEHVWTFEPLVPAPGSTVVTDLLHRLA
ncbi:TerD family protein [Streptacidiphilus sp. ASG 303]|uniref:TerD family protein n=1 Tax=Streptacidiphilus sp. ASG 303 TaxID=2896847 RepID=UPI001E36DDF5|nr:TerD family protein [Streptacidiphilus sp. ASG 303]MCD0483092.1 TerD family protein [Streptacidiphilus sp. ASG 303]